MLRLYILSACIITAVLAAPAFSSTLVTIPGTDNLWLAGMPDGTGSSNSNPVPFDTAPANSPAQYPLAFDPGDAFIFSATGAVSHGPQLVLTPLTGPDGATATDAQGYHFTSRLSPNANGSENGIANVTAPINAIMGVFLDNNQPDTEGAVPTALNFGSNPALDFTTLTPQLRQPFFIGNGLTSGNITQLFYAPAGATRLYFSSMDQSHWSDNTGSFQLTATDLPEPSTMLVLIAGITLVSRRQKLQAAD